ncbi:MAG: hypothetical protein ACSHX8_04845 [Opitutaceae bacterium]
MSSISFLPKHLRLILFLSLTYLLAWLGYYGQITLGQYLSPDEANAINAALASDGQSPSTLYQVFLNSLSWFTESKETLITLARSANLLALVLASVLAANAAGHYWKNNHAASAAAFLIGFNPLLAFRVGQVTPVIMAVAAIAVFAWCYFHWIRRPRTLYSLTAGIALTAAACLETAFVGPALAWPLIAFSASNRHKTTHLCFALVAPAATLALIAVSTFSLQSPLQAEDIDILSNGYGLIANSETKDGVSYAMHSRLHLLLFLNPICWGILGILAVGGLYSRFKDGHTGKSVYYIYLLGLLFSIGFIMSNGGGQNRLALIPFLAIFSAGSICVIPKIWHHAGRPTRLKIIMGTCICAIITFSSHIMDQNSVSRHEANYTFMAKANIELHKDEQAITWAEKLLAIDPDRKDMHSVLVRAAFNEWAYIPKPKTLTTEATHVYLQEIEKADNEDPLVASIRGIYLWKSGKKEEAMALWNTHADKDALARSALYWTNTIRQPLSDYPVLNEEAAYFEFFKTVSSINRSSIDYGADKKRLDNMFAEAY